MSYKRYPNTGTLSWTGTETLTTLGVFVAGTLSTIYRNCSVQDAVVGGRMSVGAGGDYISYTYFVTMPKITTTFTTQQDMTFITGGESYQVLRIRNYDKHTELFI